MRQQDSDVASIRLKVSGRVQGIGFRPFVYRLAHSLSLTGSVRNTSSGLDIELNGQQAQLDEFRNQLLATKPSAAQVESIELERISPQISATSFSIIESETDSNSLSLSTNAPEVSPDLALCSSCLDELFDTNNRRYLHPFISCTQCGPRYSIIAGLPYDRDNTSMAKFDMCSTCQHEYSTPSNAKRFHSQTNACNDCGPQLALVDKKGIRLPLEQNQALIDFCAEQLKQGAIIAIKSIGGFHLICDAKNSESIKRLRKVKQRPDKPFALMALNTPSLEPIVELDSASLHELKSSHAPIVLLPKKRTLKPDSKQEEEDWLAPNLSDLGCMLPYTPLHYLIFHALLGRPKGINWLEEAQNYQLLVTSANLPDEPIVYDNDKCIEQLASLADFALLNDRDILAPSDDSVIQAGEPKALIRRSRGIVPTSIALLDKQAHSLACGAHLKNTFCLTQGDKAYISPYHGELDKPENFRRFQANIAHYQHLFGNRIDQYCADLHPDYVSTHFAEKNSQTSNSPLIKVQHHHAHLTSLLAEQTGQAKLPALALILDGNGLGDDNQAWGGELFYVDSKQIERIGHLEKIAIPGGDIATREIWRTGANLLAKTSREQAFEAYADSLKNELTSHFILNGTHHFTSSAGRWFDAAASIIGVRQECTYEGQAAAELESLARSASRDHVQSLVKIDEKNQLLLSPLLPYLSAMENKPQAAYLFHRELVDGLVRWLEKSSKQRQTKAVYCSGGCFQNRLLRESLNEHLTSQGFKVYFPIKLPANDGGIALGQAYLSHWQNN